MRYIWGISLLLLLAGCGSSPQAAPTPTLGPTPTFPPTVVPGSVEDQREATIIVRQFGQAVAQGDTLVALLVLSPSAQRIVAAADLESFLGRRERPRAFDVKQVHLTEDVATAECTVDYAEGPVTLQLRLIRFEGQWKIDGRVPE